MSSSLATAAFNPTLTNYASGIAPDFSSALADFLAPTVEVPAGRGHFKKYDENTPFTVYDTSRPVGGVSNRITFNATDGNFDCQPQALEVGVDDAERIAEGDDGARIDEAKIKTLVSATALAHESRVITAIRAGVTTQSGQAGCTGNWISDTVDPVKEINAQIEVIANNTGRMPNRIAFGLDTWRTFMNNAMVLKRQPGSQLIGLSLIQAAAMLLNPAIQIKVGVISYNQAKLGNTPNKKNIYAGECFVFYADDNPDIYDPSFAKTFTTKKGGVEAVRTYRDERARSTVHAVDWSEDIEICSTTTVKRITVTTS